MMRVLLFLLSNFLFVLSFSQVDTLKECYSTGKVKSISIVISDSLNEIKWYYPSGELNVEEMLIDGDLSGKRIVYYKNGHTKSIENFVLDERQDSAFYYYESGNLKRSGVFKDDFYVGEWLTYHENGELKNKGVYLEGNPDGEWDFFNEKGRRFASYQYENGEKVRYTTFKPRSQRVLSVFSLE